MSLPAIQFNAVCKSYGEVPVLRNISFAVERGETIGLLGANGAGKTTLIKSLLDLCAIDSGDIRIFETSHRKSAARQHIAYLPERFQPPPYCRGWDFLRLSRQLQHEVYDQNAANAIGADLNLPSVELQRPVRTYSKGMTQKLGLVACFLSNKPILLLDEPLSGLDPHGRLLAKEQLRRAREQGRSIVLCTHMISDLYSLCDRFIILHRGNVVFNATPEEFVARFGNNDPDEAFVRCQQALTSNTDAAQSAEQ